MAIGKIYKIIHNQSNIIYIGSTFNNLKDRFYNHKITFKQYINNNHSEIAIYPYFLKYGIENFKIVLIKEYEVIDKKHLESKEQLWINKLKSINKNNSFSIYKLYQKQYQIKNKDELLKKQKEYNKNNKDKIKVYKKEYYKKNKDIINKIIKEKNKEKINCICGGSYIYSNKKRHEQSKKHLKF